MYIPKIVVVDDDLRMRQLIGDLLAQEGIEAIITADSVEAAGMIAAQKLDIVITDLKIPYMDGLSLLQHAKDVDPDIVVIVITGYGTVDSAIKAMKLGAYDYVQKPFEPDELMMIIHRALQHVRLVTENKRLLNEVESYRYDELIGTSKAINEIKDLVAKVALLDITVLLQGETGTGKELIARLIHRNSKRNNERFLPINCGAIPESLLESELFGYEKGAFTGADRTKVGLFEAADKGTIFTDEINSTSANFQVKLLRVLEEGSFMRVGGTELMNTDIRVIAASSLPLQQEIETGRFRWDLFYRLNVISVEIPPLRKRREDIPLIAYHYLNKYAHRYNKNLSSISNEVVKALTEYSWPGNVRELRNVIERAVIMESGTALTSVHLPKTFKKDIDCEEMCSRLMTVDDMEAALIERTLRALHGQKGRAAEVLGISPTSLWRKMKKYGLA
ncbi:MAG: sigma-54-dependent Fis family transcriptional regulator [Desulfobacteraceae bacterium]|nr:MAG: sigma-54-dependent Fis family transcriptional regulator [Desulfobacteraceae bacterium]